MLYCNNSVHSIVVECVLCPSHLSPVTDYLFIVIPHPLVENFKFWKMLSKQYCVVFLCLL